MSKRSLVILTATSTGLVLLCIVVALAAGWGPLHNLIIACENWLSGLAHQ
jgi:hypothetical protein